MNGKAVGFGSLPRAITALSAEELETLIIYSWITWVKLFSFFSLLSHTKKLENAENNAMADDGISWILLHFAAFYVRRAGEFVEVLVKTQLISLNLFGKLLEQKNGYDRNWFHDFDFHHKRIKCVYPLKSSRDSTGSGNATFAPELGSVIKSVYKEPLN